MTGAVPGAGGGAGSVQVGFVTRSGSEPVRRQRLSLLPLADAQHELLLQQGQQPRQEQRHRPPVRRPPRRPDRAAGLRRPRQGVLLLQLRASVPAAGTDPHAHDAARLGDERHLRVGRDGRRRDDAEHARPDGARRRQRPDRDVRSDDRRAAREDSDRARSPPARSTTCRPPTTLQYVFQSPGESNQYAPTTRVDVNLSPKQRLTGTYWLQRFATDPDLLNNRDPIFPGQPNSATQTSWRNTGSTSLRSTLSASMVNELRGGFQTSPSSFFVRHAGSVRRSGRLRA